MPSRLESLSMVTLEAWWAERPVLVNGKCEVLRGQCPQGQRRSVLLRATMNSVRRWPCSSRTACCGHAR